MYVCVYIHIYIYTHVSLSWLERLFELLHLLELDFFPQEHHSVNEQIARLFVV